MFLGVHKFLSFFLPQRKIMNVSYCNPRGSAYHVNQTFALGECFVSYLYVVFREVSESHPETVVGESKCN